MTLPFSFTYYGTSYTQGYASSNGNFQLTGNTSYLGANCLPDPNLGAAILPYREDLHEQRPARGRVVTHEHTDHGTILSHQLGNGG